MNDYTFGSDMLMSESIGFIDLALETKKFNELTAVTVEIAQTLVKYGMESINRAITGASQPWYKADLPGATSRNNVKGHLQWHADTVARMTASPTAPYLSGNDLKSWVLRSYEELNAVEEGSAFLESNWNAMWAEIDAKLASYSKAVLSTAASAAGSVIENATGVPIWALLLGGATVLAGAGVVMYKLRSR